MKASRLKTWIPFRADRVPDEDRRLGGPYISANLALGGILSVAGVVVVTLDAGWHRVWSGLLHADWPWIVAAPLCVLVSHAGYVLTYREVIRAGKGPELAGEEAAAMVTTGFGPLSPRGGFALDADAFRKFGLSRREASLRVRTLGITEYAVLAPVTFSAAVFMAVEGEPTQAGVLPSWIIGVPAGTAVVVGLLVWYRQAGRPEAWWSPLRHALGAVEETWRLIRSWPQGLLALVGMLLYWASDIGALAACAVVFTHRHTVGLALIVGYATGYALTRRSLPLAGAGVVEAGLPFALNWVGYPLATAILSVIAYRVCNLWLAMVPAIAGVRRVRDL